ncbi:site-2 protease family protein [Desulfobacterota bacterium AH_259_B03_O07]|nr:site-2 protease family protein [Desulfobacterota bacterium AH_259_B03_O07]
MDLNFKLIIIQAPVILLSLTVHEYCHGWVANYLGDDTAMRQGRLTLNPIVHLDVIGTILMFIVGFGWAKPVPVNPHNFEDPRKGMLLVALAGPAANLLTAICAGLILRYIVPSLLTSEQAISGIYSTSLVIIILSLQYGVALAIFNMIPIPPLDGSRVLYGLLPEKQAYAYSRFEPYGMLILVGLFIFGGRVFTYILWYPVSVIAEALSGLGYFQLWQIVSYFTS